ncbi:hypothetical protein N7535_007105 [Penicillium sp. DV-2018c]|nr:hypothetical protein N7461_006800 [Penicillium sp. DV-2018c]KAJ5567799.1 hypothetical protein N7535_007105 [Penicillium sp. DV-2018c]
MENIESTERNQRMKEDEEITSASRRNKAISNTEETASNSVWNFLSFLPRSSKYYCFMIIIIDFLCSVQTAVTAHLRSGGAGKKVTCLWLSWKEIAEIPNR